MRFLSVFVLACLFTGLLPLITPAASPRRDIVDFPGWPAAFRGQHMSGLPLSDEEQRFLQDFPGRMGKFTDGRRHFLLRWVTRETRMLHPAAHCYRGSGYRITPLPLYSDSAHRLWGCFKARKGSEILVIRERIEGGRGASWTDVSAWYWDAALGKSAGPWLAITIVETGGRSRQKCAPPGK